MRNKVIQGNVWRNVPQQAYNQNEYREKREPVFIDSGEQGVSGIPAEVM